MRDENGKILLYAGPGPSQEFSLPLFFPPKHLVVKKKEEKLFFNADAGTGNLENRFAFSGVCAVGGCRSFPRTGQPRRASAAAVAAEGPRAHPDGLIRKARNF